MFIWIWPVLFLFCVVLSVESEEQSSQQPSSKKEVTVEERAISSSASKELTLAQMTMSKMKLEISKTKQEEAGSCNYIRNIVRKKTYINKTVDSVVTEFWEQRSNRINATTAIIPKGTTVPINFNFSTTPNFVSNFTITSSPSNLQGEATTTSWRGSNNLAPLMNQLGNAADLERDSAKKQRQDGEKMREMVNAIRSKYA